MLRRSCAGRERGDTAHTSAPSCRALPLRPLAALSEVATVMVARSPPRLRTLGGEGGESDPIRGHRDVFDRAASTALPCSCGGRSLGLLAHTSVERPYPVLRPSPEHGRYGADPLRKRRIAPGAPLVARADMWHASRGRAVTKGALTATSDPLRPHPAAAGAAKCRGDHRTAAFPASAVTWEGRAAHGTRRSRRKRSTIPAPKPGSSRRSDCGFWRLPEARTPAPHPPHPTNHPGKPGTSARITPASASARRARRSCRSRGSESARRRQRGGPRPDRCRSGPRCRAGSGC